MDQDINFNTNISTGPFDSNEKDNLSSECQEEVEYTPQKRFTRTTLYLLAMTISLLGNSAVIMIVRKNGRMRTLTHYLIVNMAVADLLITIFHMPCKLQIQLTNRRTVLPSPLSSLFVLNSDCHQYLTRQKDNLHLHTHKYSFSLRVQGPQIWNDIPLSLRNSLTLSSYKYKLRDYFQSL